MLIVLFAVTYAQVIWAQIALAILIILGPIFIPFLVFEPMAFLFWGWFKGMLTYSLYAVIAGCVLRVFSAVGIAYITTLGGANLDTQSMTQVGLWTLAVIPLFIAGLLSSLKCGELAAMLGKLPAAEREGADSWVWRQRQGWQRPAAERQRPRQQHQEGSSEPR